MCYAARFLRNKGVLFTATGWVGVVATLNGRCKDGEAQVKEKGFAVGTISGLGFGGKSVLN